MSYAKERAEKCAKCEEWNWCPYRMDYEQADIWDALFPEDKVTLHHDKTIENTEDE